MHFPIIIFEEVDTNKEDYEDSLPYDDPTINEHTDYVGDMYTEEERSKVIKSDWLKDLFENVALINVEDESITFLSDVQIKTTINGYLKDVARELYDKAMRDELDAFHLKIAGDEYKNSDTLFYHNGYCQTSMSFMDDAHWYAGQTFKFGNIFDAHY